METNLSVRSALVFTTIALVVVAVYRWIKKTQKNVHDGISLNPKAIRRLEDLTQRFLELPDDLRLNIGIGLVKALRTLKGGK